MKTNLGRLPFPHPNERQVGGDHYKSSLQHWDLVSRNNVGYLEGCATKYLTRWRRRGTPRSDLEKTKHFIEKMLDLAQNTGYRPSGLVSWEEIRLYGAANRIPALDLSAITILLRWSDSSGLRAAAKLVERLLKEELLGVE